MEILIIGKGGREHAIAWKVAQSELVSTVFVAPGNDGMQNCAKVKTIDIAENNFPALLDFALVKRIGLTIIGPEGALLQGLADLFLAHNLKVFAPCKKAATIEGSKTFAKELMFKYNIPTARYAPFADYEKAKTYVVDNGVPVVIKFDGLAAGKGVTVAMTFEEADQALQETLLDQRFGKGEVIIEEFLQGIEFSLMALVHGETVLPLSIAQDHKRVFDGDKGANTGGMGAYTPVPVISQEVVDEAVKTIMIPTAKALVTEGIPFSGVLYGGLMLTAEGTKVIEFNARFGDPETEVVLPKMKSDLVQHILDLFEGKKVEIINHEEAFLGVVMATTGYPDSDTKGKVIEGLEEVENTIFHMGTRFSNQQWLTHGGRSLFVVGKGRNLQEAREDAYQAVKKIKCTDLFYRNDIGHQSI
jgi:phosphoribosylamine--glycine ligase